jgi:hypothetical protein
MRFKIGDKIRINSKCYDVYNQTGIVHYIYEKCPNHFNGQYEIKLDIPNNNGFFPHYFMKEEELIFVENGLQKAKRVIELQKE